MSLPNDTKNKNKFRLAGILCLVIYLSTTNEILVPVNSFVIPSTIGTKSSFLVNQITSSTTTSTTGSCRVPSTKVSMMIPLSSSSSSATTTATTLTRTMMTKRKFRLPGSVDVAPSVRAFRTTMGVSTTKYTDSVAGSMGEEEENETEIMVEKFPDEVLDKDDDEIDDDDYDEITYSQEELLAKKEQWMKDLARLSRSSARDDSAIDKALSIFDEMFELYVRTEESTVWPNTEVYNLLIETHAYSKAYDSAERAEALLDRMEDPENDFVARPNFATYVNVLDAWAMKENPAKARNVIDRLEMKYKETKNEELRPSVEIYNKMIKAYGIVNSFEQAEEIFRTLLDMEDGSPLKANYKSWIQIMKAYAAEPVGRKKTQALFKEMVSAYRAGEEEYKPKAEAFNCLLRAIAHKPTGAEETETLLFKMIEKFRTGDENARPNSESFRLVIQAQLKRKNSIGAKIEQLLEIQEGLYENYPVAELLPDRYTFSKALSVISRCKDIKKAKRAQRIFEMMKSHTEDGQGPLVRDYQSVISACAYTNDTPEGNMEAFQIAVDTFNELRNEAKKLKQKKLEANENDTTTNAAAASTATATTLSLTSGCYAMFLKSCANLMPSNNNPKRDMVVDSVFQQCCSEGLVNDFVLNQFERAASESLQLERLGGFLDDDVRLPLEWSMNVPDHEKMYHM